MIRKDPLELLHSLEDVEPADPSLNWDPLREVAGSRAVAATSRSKKKDWAAVAVRAAEEGQAAGLIDRDMATRGVVMLKAKLISRLGAEPGDPILDLGGLLEWFAEEVEGIDADAEWPLESTPVEDLRVARRVKSDLVALSPVIDDPRCSGVPVFRP